MKTALTRRLLLAGLLASMASGIGIVHAANAQARPSADKPTLTVYKDVSCGCCHVWVEYMQAKGYRVFAQNTDIAAIKKQYGIDPNLQSCHTTLVSGYIIEGHVPEGDIVRLLKEKPAGVVGLTIPGMPASAPGMDLKPFQPYTVLAFDKAGKTTVWARHTKPE